MTTTTTPVLDTCVLVDVLVKTRPRHEKAIELAGLLKGSRPHIQVPWHAMFELRAALKSEEAAGRLVMSQTAATLFPEGEPLIVTYVSIDEKFFNTFFNDDLPHLKAGDLIFLAMAKGLGAPLITEDRKLYEAAASCGVQTYTIQGYLDVQG